MKALTRIFPYYTPYRRRVLVGLACVVISAALASVIPALLQRAVDGLRDGRATRDLVTIALVMVAVALVMGVFRYGARQSMVGLSRYIENDLRADLFAKLLTLDAAWYARARIGEIIALLTNDVGAVRMASGPAIMYITGTACSTVFSVVLMLSVEPRLTGLALLPMVFLPIVMSTIGKRIHDQFEAAQEHFAKMTTMVQEHLAGIRVVRAYRQEQAEQQRFADMNVEYERLNMKLAALNGTMNALLGALAGAGALIVLTVGGAFVLRGSITVGAFLAFSLYLTNLTWPLIALGWVINLFQRGSASMGRINALLDAEPGIADPVSPRHLATATAGRAIEFRNVSFAYPVAQGVPREVLRNISFTLREGETLGLVGATGSGKSTLLELIPRLRDPIAGEIFVDGIPIKDLPLAELRAEVGYVPQDALVFSDTIGANLTYGANDETAHLWAARLADLDETVAKFREGYDTLLGERGVNLSGGQKQRATIARALARRPSIVLLDDALSAVDTQTEARILHALREGLAQRTAIIASHRVSALRDSNWIIVLDDGAIVEQGRHDDLVQQKGRYWELLKRQQLEQSIEEPSAA